MNLINEVLAGVLGSYSLAFYITYFIFVLFGVLVSVRLHAFRRDKSSKHTPYKFSWKFLLQDNLLRMITSMAVVFVVIRLGQDLLNIEPNYGGAVLLGLSFDQILIMIEKLEIKARDDA